MKKFTVIYKSTYGWQCEQAVEALNSTSARNIVKRVCGDVKRIIEVREG